MIAALLAAALRVQQDSPELASGVPAPAAPAAAAAPSTPLRIDHEFRQEEITQALADLAAAHPRFARVESIGSSQGGRAIQVLTVTDFEAGDPREKPAILFAGSGPAAEVHAAESVLGIARALLDGGEPELAARLAETSLYLAPSLDPDRRAEPGVEPAILFDRNFPLGWEPETVRRGSGAFPLAIPEVRAAATFLGERTNISLIVGFQRARPERGAPWKGAELPEADRAILEALARAPGAAPAAGEPAGPLAPWMELGSPGGGLLDYAFQALGIYACAFRCPPVDAPGLEPALASLVPRALELVAALPRLRLETEGLRQLAPGLWQLDLALRNTGRLPTLSQLGGRRRLPGALRVSMNGAKLVATAHRMDAEAPYQADGLRADTPELVLRQDVLLPGETRWLRLIVEGTAGSSLGILGSSLRAGRTSLAVSLE